MPTFSQLEKALTTLKGFERPKVPLEQYATDAHLASRMMVMIENEYNSLTNSFMADLGCGSGVLSLAASLFEPSIIFSVDLDPEALSVFKNNMISFHQAGFDYGFIEPVLGDALQFPNFFRLDLDTVVSNPPFGTKNNAGIDVEFVKAGLERSDRVFSLHKSSTRNFLERKVGGDAIASMSFNIPNQFSFHRKKNVTVDVDLMHFEKRNVK